MGEVRGLKLQQLQRRIKWSGVVLLEQTGDKSESILAEQEWPLKSGNLFYVCLDTGLIFSKQSGDCKQSTRVRLLLDTVTPIEMTQKQYTAWARKRDASEKNTYGRKSYSLPGGEYFDCDE